jgi:hypothetical protein
VSRERVYTTEGWEAAEWRAPSRAEQLGDPAPPSVSEPPRPQKPWYRHPLGIAGITLAILILVSLLGSVLEPEQTPSNSQQKPDASAEKFGEKGLGTFAAQVEREVGSNFGGGRITSRCEIIDQTWHCFFDRYESPEPGRIDVFMAFPETVSAAEARTLARDARTQTFNMAGLTIRSLDTVVSFNNGAYSGTTNRADVPLGNSPR